MRTTPGIAIALAVVGVGALLWNGCGAKFPVPTESKGQVVPPDDSYTFKGSLESVVEVTDVLITRSSGNQILIAKGALPDTRAECTDGSLPGGSLELYPIFPPAGGQPLSIEFNDLWRPQLLAENGGRLFVYDAGDSCTCCGVDYLPRIKGYLIGNPAPQFVFLEPDTSWVGIRGLAAADDRTFYVSGTFKVREPDERGAFSRRFRDRIWRYKEVSPNTYERDQAWEVLPGTGLGFVGNHQGIAWGPVDDPFLWVADGEKQAVQKMIIETDANSHGLYAFDGTSSGERFSEPVDVDIDGFGNIFVIDRGSARVLRFFDEITQATFFEQGLVNRINNTAEPVLSVPSRGAVLDTIVYVSDPGNSALRRYERRSK